jgi:apolipoprotein D and lipocalin family protein
MRYLVLAAALLLSACAANPVYRQTTAPLPVASIDLDRYLGLWHEQARLPNSFEEGCVRVTAEYGRRADGLISVLNSCVEANGRERDAQGRARVVGEAGEGKLKVSFFGPFWGDYWVLARGENYEWSIVGEPGGRYLWLLTRSETITPAQRAEFERRITELGYRPSDMEWAQPR